MGLRSSRRRGLAVGLGLAAVALAQVAGAQEQEMARLVYRVAPDVTGCPDEASFRNLVTARLGYDPFTPSGKHDAAVTLTREHATLRGSARIKRQGQPEPGVRELTGAPDQCEALALALATTVALALDPVRALRGPEDPKAAPGAPPVPAAPPPAPPIPAPPIAAPQSYPPQSYPPPIYVLPVRRAERTHVGLFATGSVVASLAAAPGPSMGGEIGVGLRVKAFSIAAAVRVETTPGAAMERTGARIGAMIVAGDLVPCANIGGWMACGVVRMGMFQGREADTVTPSLGGSLFAAIGARGGYAFPITDAVALTGSLEAALSLVRTSLIVDHAIVWTAPPVFAGLDLGVRVTLF